MEVREELKEIIEKAKEAAIAAGELPEGDYAAVQRLEVPKSKEFGDYSTNAAMQWARTAHKAPRMIAESIVKHLDTPLVTRTEIAGAGFINFYLAADTVYSELKQILKAGPSYGDLPKNKKRPHPCRVCLGKSDRPSPHRTRQRRCLWLGDGESAARGRL